MIPRAALAWLALSTRSPRFSAAVEAGAAAAANFAVLVALARLFPSGVLAGYGVALSMAFALMALHRIALVVPIAIISDQRFKRRLGVAFGAHLVITTAAAGGMILISLLVAVWTGVDVWWAAAVASPAIVLLLFSAELERVALIKTGRSRLLAAVGMATFAATLAASLAVWLLALRPAAFLSLLGALGLLRSFVLVAWVLRVAPAPPWRAIRMAWRRHGRLAIGNVFGAALCSHAPVFALATLSTAGATAAFVAIRSLYAPAQVVLRSIETVDRTRFHASIEQNGAGGRSAPSEAVLRALLRSAVVASPILAAGPWLVPVAYGEQYGDHLATLALWAAIVSLMNAAAVLDTFVAHQGRLDVAIAGQAIGGLVAVALSALLVPAWADAGAAAAAIAGWSVIIASGIASSRIGSTR